MDFAQVAIGNLVGIVGFVLVIAGVMKLFQAASTLNEIKELLGDIKRNTADHLQDHPLLPGAPKLPYAQSGEEMLRALSEAQEPPVRPEIIQPR